MLKHLLQEDIDEGKILVDCLREKGIAKVALWVFNEEKNQWNLYLSHSNKDKNTSILAIYDEIDKIEKVKNICLIRHIKILSFEAVKELECVSYRRIEGKYGDLYIDDAVVYI